MKFWTRFFKPEMVAPVLALFFSTGVCLLLVGTRVLSADEVHGASRRYVGLIWNLFLAWLPFLFALQAAEEWGKAPKRHWRLFAFTAAWLLFAPNAPYIFTDAVHISSMFTKHYWVDLVMVLACGLTGLMLWFVALYLVQGMVREKFGGPASWAFVAAEAGLTSVGIYLGRFARFNSWDVVTKPVEVYRGVSGWMTTALGDKPTFAFSAFFAAFLFSAYLMFYSLTQLAPMKAKTGS